MNLNEENDEEKELEKRKDSNKSDMTERVKKEIELLKEKDRIENDNKGNNKGENMKRNSSNLDDAETEKKSLRSDKSKTKKSVAKKFCIVLIVLLTIVWLLASAYFVYDNFFKQEDSITFSMIINSDDFNFNIIDRNSKSRPYAVMIGNTEDAWPQFSVNEAIVVYEMPVEAGISRLMAIYKDKPKLEKVGPLRSARHYFLDYVKEYDAIFVHEGHSPRAASEIYSRKIDSVEYTDGLFYRDETRWAPHNAISSSKRMLDAAKSRGFSLTTKTKTPLKYSMFPVKLKDSVSATTVEAGYSYAGDLKLVYNAKTKKYEKYEFDELLKDGVTKKPLAATNIIIVKADTTLLTGYGSGKGRVHVETDGELSGYYFTEGEGVKIKATKKTINSQTIYTLKDGTELKINDGNTFIFIIPDTQDIKIKGVKKEEVKEKEKDKEAPNDEVENGEEVNVEEEKIKEERLKLEELFKEKKIKITREVQ